MAYLGVTMDGEFTSTTDENYRTKMITFSDENVITNGKLAFGMHTAWLIAASLVTINLAGSAKGLGKTTLIGLAWASEALAGVMSAGLVIYTNDSTFAFVGSW